MTPRRSKRLTAGFVAVAAAVCAAALGLGAGTASAAPHNWEKVAQCESNNNWSTNTGNGFFGGLQFLPETWKSHGGTGLASEASKAEQILVAERVLKTQGPGAWPVCGQYLTLADPEAEDSEPALEKNVSEVTESAATDTSTAIARAALSGARELAAERAAG